MQTASIDALAAANPGIVAEDLLKLCQGDPRTVKPIAGEDLVHWLAANALTPRLQRSAAAIGASGKVEDVRSGDVLAAFVTYAASGRNFDTNQTAYAAQAQAMLAGLLQAYQQSGGTLGVSPDEAAQLIALGGGYQVFDATADDCKATVERVAKRVERDAPIQLLMLANNARYNANAAKLAAMQMDAAVAVPADLAALDAVGEEGK